MALIEHPAGNYLFLPGIAPYSCGVVAAPRFEIVHVTLHRPVPYRAGFERIERFLAAAGRPKAALCAIELRSPRPFSFPGFAEFNAAYAAILESWGLFVEGRNPIARTNVAPEVAPPAEPSLYGFSYTRPDGRGQAATFVVAGSGELPEGVLASELIVARGDTSPIGVKTKASFVLDLMENRLRGLGVGWAAVSDANLYTVHSLDRLLPEVILPRMGLNSAHWHYTRPPIEEIEFEMDLRGMRNDVRLSSE